MKKEIENFIKNLKPGYMYRVSSDYRLVLTPVLKGKYTYYNLRLCEEFINEVSYLETETESKQFEIIVPKPKE